MLRSTLRSVLSRESDIEVVAEACNGEQALALALALSPNLVLMDIVMPVMDRISRERNRPRPVFFPKPRVKSFFLSSAEIPTPSSSQTIRSPVSISCEEI